MLIQVLKSNEFVYFMDSCERTFMYLAERCENRDQRDELLLKFEGVRFVQKEADRILEESKPKTEEEENPMASLASDEDLIREHEQEQRGVLNG